MEALMLGYFFTEYPNCELMSFGFQFLNLFSNFAFLVVAYLLYKKGGASRWFAFLVVFSALGSFLHHLLPLNETVPLDVLPAVVVAAVALLFSFRNLTRGDWLTVVVVGLGSLAVFHFDLVLCNAFPFGTHFIWHFLAAYLLYLLGSRI